jgi:hypothetical protein
MKNISSEQQKKFEDATQAYKRKTIPSGSPQKKSKSQKNLPFG